MKILRIESLVYGVDDLDASIRYYEDWGLALERRGTHGADFVLPSGQTICLRANDDRSLPDPVENGSTVREVVWGVDGGASLDELAAELSKDREVEHEADGLRVRDPWGLSLRFVATERSDVPADAPSRGRNEPFAVDARIRPRRIGHVVFFVPASRFDETAAFYLDRLQFRLTDRVPGFGDFMRCAGALDHHSLFILQQGERAGFNHAAFEVANFDEVIVGGRYMLERDWKAATSPGRHVMGSNLFWYFASPCGGNTEYFADMDRMDDAWKPRVWEKHPGFAWWMMDAPTSGNKPV